MRAWLTNQRGFTLAELLVVTAVTGLVMAGVLVIQQQGQEAYQFGASRVETQQNARVALALMIRELRSASAGAAAPTSGIVSIPSATDITFLDQCGISVRYSLAGTTLNRTGANYTDRDNCVSAGNSAVPVIGGVQSLTMTYYSDGGSTTTTNPALVKTIKIRIVTMTEMGSGPSRSREGRATMESTVQLRATLS